MITIDNIRTRQTDTQVELRGRVRSHNDLFDDFDVWWRYPLSCREVLTDTANPFLAAMLLPSMRLGQELRIDGRISQTLLEGAQKYMQIAAKWWPVKPIRITADPCPQATQRGSQIAAFFSGGLDSFYTLLKNEASKLPDEQKISRLIFIRGFDVGLTNDKLYDLAMARISAIADALDKELIVVSTNLMAISRQIVPWDWYHGPALISVPLAISPLFCKVLIPATFSYRELFPWGSHPLTDPLWSTESMTFEHDGCEADRIEKISSYVGRSRLAMDNLRVCSQPQTQYLNCGVCEKCIRTMLNLQIAGVLEACTSFPRRFTVSDLRNLDLTGIGRDVYAMENYEALRASGGDRRILRALRFAVKKGPLWKARQILRKTAGKIDRNVNKHILGKHPESGRNERKEDRIILKQNPLP